MFDAPEFSNVQTTSLPAEGSMVVGRIRPPHAMWAALEGIAATNPVRNGVLLIFSADIKGRIGIFCNRYISGAIVEPTGESGLDALRKLLAIEGGMFGFRACMGDESRELAQELALDINELLDSREQKSNASAVEALQVLTGFREDWMPPEEDAAVTTHRSRAATPQATEPVASIEALAKPNDDTDELQKPAHFSFVETYQYNSFSSYNELLVSQQQKVVRDIERSLEKGRATAASNAEEAVSDLKLLSEFMQHEQSRAQQWQGLDDIPTPRAGNGTAAGGAYNSGATTGEFDRQCTDLLHSSLVKIQAPKEFVKKSAEPKQVRTRAGRSAQLSWLNPRYLVAAGCVLGFGIAVSIASSAISQNSFAVSLDTGKKELEQNQADQAIVALDSAIQKNPANDRGYFYRGLAYAQVGDYERACNDLREALNKGASEERVLLVRAAAGARSGHLSDAIQDCAAVLKINPKSVEAQMLSATCCERLGRFDLVEKHTTSALQMVKDKAQRAPLLVQRGYARIKGGNLRGAGQDFTEAISIHRDASIYLKRAGAYSALKNWRAAVADYGEVLKREPKNVNARIARAIAYKNMGSEKAALKDLDIVISENKNAVEALVQRATLYMSKGNYRQALPDLDAATRLMPSDKEIAERATIVYRRLNKTLPPTLAPAKTEQERRNSMIADAVSNPSVVRLPKDTKQLVALGYKYLRSGDTEIAVTALTEAVRREPNNPQTRRYLAHALLQAGSNDAAIAQFDALQSIQPLERADAVAYAKGLIKAGNNDHAIDALVRFVNEHPDDAGVRAELIKAYNTIGFSSKAQEAFNDGIRVGANASQRQVLDSALKSKFTSAKQ